MRLINSLIGVQLKVLTLNMLILASVRWQLDGVKCKQQLNFAINLHAHTHTLLPWVALSYF